MRCTTARAGSSAGILEEGKTKMRAGTPPRVPHAAEQREK
eukprot:CAMPEP_0118985886 /NCGR_PEP_ID=MMETSP1173-20130426/40975_1 /TAXON_ID=1034831 /ORGANISM="Rhizochromulina marina cf, Strain CCMP1243" /LENGTH=39 /DNA_ID= /DNA_START= /DNA_END= /DNA_ORIENTATION=